MSSIVISERLSACLGSKSERVGAYDHPALRAIRGVTVSRQFREAALRNFQALRERNEYWLLFCYLLFGSWLDEDTSRLLLCAEILSEIEGRDPDNSEAEKFLIRFRDEVLRPTGREIEWTGWHEGKCRQLWKRHFGQKFEEILRREHFGYWDDSGPVYLLDGSAYNSSNARRFRREQREAAGRLPALCEHAESIRTYMNTLKANLFTKKVRENFRSALKASFNLPDNPVRDAQLRILRHIRSQPQAFYFPSGEGNTVRLSTRETIPNLKTNVRRALTNGWRDADLRCSQFAICATVWQVPELLEFLQTKQSLWNYLFDYLNVPHELRILAKPVLKKTVYAMCYGMPRPRLKGRCAYWLACEELDKRLFGRLQEAPLILALLNARDNALQTIAANGGAENCFGQWQAVTDKRQPRDIMAAIAQAWEMKLIHPAFEVAQRTHDFRITLFQHDGFSVHFTQRAMDAENRPSC